MNSSDQCGLPTGGRRVLFVSGTNRYGAGGRLLVYWCRGLRRLGWQCIITFLAAGDLEEIFLQECVDFTRSHTTLQSWPRKRPRCNNLSVVLTRRIAARVTGHG
jgi:hypothetical protein